MQQITELERRITTALERIGTGLDRLPKGGAPAPSRPHRRRLRRRPPPPPANRDELAALRAKLEEERTVTAQLQERLKSVNEDAIGYLESISTGFVG